MRRDDWQLAEFATVVGNLRAARFGRDSAWRSTAALGALDELRHTQIPLLLIIVRHGGQIRADSGAGASFAFTLPDRGKP